MSHTKTVDQSVRAIKRKLMEHDFRTTFTECVDASDSGSVFVFSEVF